MLFPPLDCFIFDFKTAPFDPPDLLDFSPVDGAPDAPPFEMPFPPLARKAFALGFNELPSLEAVVPLDVVDLLAMDAATDAAYEGGGGPALGVELIPRASGVPPIGTELIPTEVSVEVHPELPPKEFDSFAPPWFTEILFNPDCDLSVVSSTAPRLLTPFCG